MSALWRLLTVTVCENLRREKKTSITFLQKKTVWKNIHSVRAYADNLSLNSLGS